MKELKSQDETANKKSERELPNKHNVKKDIHNIILLIFLYMLQMIPLGLTGSLPYILSSKKISYADQGTFSFAFWPFSMKLLWAPIVDAIYFKRLGKRKSWLVPLEYLIGFYMIFFSDYIKQLLDSNRSEGGGNIVLLTVIFFTFTFLAATHDVVVDGWALTMLSKENVSLSSTCESIGGTAGWFIGNVFFLVIESAEFSNKYIRSYIGLDDQEYGLVTIDSKEFIYFIYILDGLDLILLLFSIQEFMFFFGVVYIMTSTCVLFFKTESSTVIESDFSIVESYKIPWKIICLKPIQKLIFIVFTLRVGILFYNINLYRIILNQIFNVKMVLATESMGFLKLVEAGVPKENLGLLAVPIGPLQLLLPFAISRLLNGKNPFKYYRMTFGSRLILIMIFAFWVYVTPKFKTNDGQFSFSFYIICLLIEAFHSVFIYFSYIPMAFFFSQISDKNIGATYLTFLNTIQNLSRNFIGTGSLYLANCLSTNSCVYNSEINSQNFANITMSQFDQNFCASETERKVCVEIGGKCIVYFDPYYTQTILCFLFGVFWLVRISGTLYDLEKLPKSEWSIYQEKIKLRTD